MAGALFNNIFLRLPPSVAFLFLAAILRTTDGYALPRQTKTVEFHELNVVAWPPLPTEAPISPHELFGRQLNTVCGYVDGDEAAPATCAPGAHCVLDTDHGYVGCCPNGGPCTEGVYTGCVDGNSDPQTEVNPYVYTCAGSDVCYRNEYAGGYHQFGCGTASDVGTTVQTSIQGVTTRLDLPEVSVTLTGTPVSLSEPTTIGSMTGTRSRTASDTSETTSSTTSSTDSTSSTPTSTSTETATSSGTTGLLPTEAPSTGDEDGGSRTGAIVGGTLGGLAGLAIIAALLFFCLRRRRNNGREGPGPAPAAPPTTEYMSPVRSHGAAFAPLPSWQDEQPHNPNDDQHGNPYGQQLYPEQTYPTATHNANVPLAPPPPRYDPGQVAGVGTGLTPVEEETRSEMGARDIDDFSQAYTDARIGQAPSDEDLQPLREPDPVSSESSTSGTYQSPSPIRGGGGRPLWQQNRQRSRNLMWM